MKGEEDYIRIIQTVEEAVPSRDMVISSRMQERGGGT